MLRYTMYTLPAAVILLSALPPQQSQQTQDPKRFVELSSDGSCGDGRNWRTFLRNRHNSRSIRVTVRWRVANGLFGDNVFRINAGERQQIGCSADATILRAEFLNAADNAQSFVSVTSDGACGDGLNWRIFLSNTHPLRSVNVTLRWRVANEQFRTSRLLINAGARRQVGCAADAAITAASFSP